MSTPHLWPEDELPILAEKHYDALSVHRLRC